MMGTNLTSILWFVGIRQGHKRLGVKSYQELQECKRQKLSTNYWMCQFVDIRQGWCIQW